MPCGTEVTEKAKEPCTTSHLHPLNALAGLDAVAGVKNDLLTFPQAFEHLRFGPTRAPGLYRTELRPAFAKDECSPARPSTKERARGNLQSPVGLPNNDAGFDAEIVAKAASFFNRGDDISNNVDTLLLDAESGNFCKLPSTRCLRDEGPALIAFRPTFCSAIDSSGHPSK